MIPALQFDNVSMRIGPHSILRGVSFCLAPGEVLGIVGHSGAGKSMLAYSAMGLAPAGAELSGEIRLNGLPTLTLKDKAASQLRGKVIAMVFQEPMTALNPLQTIERQIVEALVIHDRGNPQPLKGAAHALLRQVGLDPDTISPARFPHELSGGQRQRVLIAIAIAGNPSVIVADEPTTALDVTIQADILTLLKRLTVERNIAMVLISHNLGVVASMADRIAVMRDGALLEASPTHDILNGTDHSDAPELAPPAPPDYPAYDGEAGQTGAEAALLRIEKLSVTYRSHQGGNADIVKAVRDAALWVRRGETLGVVGESGSGKSTLARALLGLQDADCCELTLGGSPLDITRAKSLRRLRRAAQIVFQDPYSSFNPRHRVARIIGEPLHLLDQKLTPAEKQARAAAALAAVGLDGPLADRLPHSLSGGQRQRIAIARALMIDPSLIVLDEPTSALDMAAQRKILDLLRGLQRNKGLAMIFISHDLSVIAGIAHRTAVMQSGEIVETGPTQEIMESPKHPYTLRLIESARALRLEIDTRRTNAV